MKKGRHEKKIPLIRRIRPLTRAIMAVLMCVILPVTAFADVKVDLSLGEVTVNDTQVSHTTSTGFVTEDHEGAVIVTQSNAEDTATTNTVSVSTSSNDVNLTLDGVNINNTTAVSVDAGSGTTVTVELDGTNTLSGALVKSSDDGALVIEDSNSDGGSLSAEAGYGAAIGSAMGKDVSNITINSGTINAESSWGAAIGAGQDGDASNITINGGTVNAESSWGAAIGAGQNGDASNITINGGTVNNAESSYGAAIGAGQDGDASNITINGGTVNNAESSYGAAVGGGQRGEGSDITVSGGQLDANSDFGAGIGGGQYGDGSDITICGDAQVTASSSGAYGKGAGIGGGSLGDGSNIVITDDAQVTASSILGAGIGGGSGGYEDPEDTGYSWHDGANGSNISISGNAQVDASSTSGAGIGGGSSGNISVPNSVGGGASNISVSQSANVTAASTNGAAIGGGASKTVEAEEIEVDTSELYDTGSLGNENTGTVISGVIIDPEKPVSSVISVVKAIINNYSLFDIADFAAKDLPYTEKVNGDVLYITIEGEDVDISCLISELKKLKDDGIKEVVFTTEKAEFSISVDDILASEGKELGIKVDGESVVLSIDGEEKAELVSVK